MKEIVFKAPTEEIELELINYCLNELGLTLDNFWYQWFPSNRGNNHSLHIDSNVPNLTEKIRNTFSKLSFFEFFHKPAIMEMDLRRVKSSEMFDYKYRIHFKANKEL